MSDYKPEECYEAMILECLEGFKALCELHNRPYSDRKKTLTASAELIEAWAVRLRDSA